MKDYKINNMAVIQYLTKRNEIKVLAFSGYDMQKLKHRVSIHIGQKKVLSVQFYYDITTNKDVLHLKEQGVILE